GIHIAGTDYDQRLTLRRVMPLFGYQHVGPSGREVPSPPFIDLASWHLIHWMYAPKRVRELRALRSDYADSRLHDRLVTVIEQRLGHLVLSEVEKAKIASSTHGGPAAIDLSTVERGLHAGLDAGGMAQDLHGLLAQVVDCAAECVRRAGLQPAQVDAIYLTGGSSALRPFLALLAQRFPGTQTVEGDLFGGVASGLAYSARRWIGPA
ncbi:MAG TPA: heat-shock protein, partial [Ramlibacter sp.]|nr:heat-shock protein [Ramlibacter sp.]